MPAARSLLASPRFVCRSCSRSIRSQLRRSYSTKSEDIYDVVCVGGGPAGLSLLAALRESSNRSSPDYNTNRLQAPAPSLRGSALLSSKLRISPKPRRSHSHPLNFQNRCSSLTPTSAEFLNTIGAWTHMKRERVQEYQEMQVWDGITDARIEFDWPPGSGPGRTIAYMAGELEPHIWPAEKAE